jgi:hypothetical protein
MALLDDWVRSPPVPVAGIVGTPAAARGAAGAGALLGAGAVAGAGAAAVAVVGAAAVAVGVGEGVLTCELTPVVVKMRARPRTATSVVIPSRVRWCMERFPPGCCAEYSVHGPVGAAPVRLM